MIYAKVDVDLRDHPKAQVAGAAMATWLWGLLYARGHQTDGLVPTAAIRGAWAGERVAKRDADALVACGLWELEPGGWRILKYESKNETRDDVVRRRAEVRDRVAKHRARRGGGNALHAERCNASVPGSGSLSGSGSEIDQVPERMAADPPPSHVAPIVALDEDLRAWAFGAGAPEPTRDHLESFLLHAREKGLLHADPRAAFKRWMLREKTFAASRRTRGADVTRQPADPNAPWLTLPEVG